VRPPMLRRRNTRRSGKAVPGKAVAGNNRQFNRSLSRRTKLANGRSRRFSRKRPRSPIIRVDGLLRLAIRRNGPRGCERILPLQRKQIRVDTEAGVHAPQRPVRKLTLPDSTAVGSRRQALQLLLVQPTLLPILLRPTLQRGRPRGWPAGHRVRPAVDSRPTRPRRFSRRMGSQVGRRQP
jgi:hypothetical protein